MGLIISRFRRKKTTIEILEGIEKEINGLQKNRKENQDRQKRVATGLIIYSIILYILLAVVIFLLYFPDTWPLRLLYSLPLLAFPFLIWGVRKALHWYFVKRIAGNDLALRDLREKKKQMLEDVMETETYKKAKEILEKFDPARFKKLERDEQTSHVPATPSPSSSGTALLQRKNVVSHQPPTPMPVTPAMRMTLPRPSTSAAVNRPTPNPFGNTPLRAPMPAQSATPSGGPMSVGRGRGGGLGGGGGRPINPQQMMQSQAMPPQMARPYGPPGPPMPRTVLPRDRGMMDRMMDYLVGDGPENRYALICRACHSHNGMALMEEFEYMSFRCCYCFIMNPARKQRPLAPRLEFFTPNAKVVTLTKPEESDDSDSSEDEEEEEEGLKKAVDDKKKNDSPSSVNNVRQSSSSSSSTSSSAAAKPAPTQPPVSSQNRVAPSRSKLPVSGGAVNVDKQNPSGVAGLKSNVPSSRLSQSPVANPSVGENSRKNLFPHPPSHSTLSDNTSQNLGSAESMGSSSKKSETDAEDLSSGVKGADIDTAPTSNVNENCSASNMERDEGIIDELSHFISSSGTTVSATTADPAQAELDKAEALQTGELDDEYEMIAAIDGEDQEVNEDVVLGSSSSLDGKGSSSGIGKGEVHQ